MKSSLIGNCSQCKTARERVVSYAQRDEPVLIVGEAGTGREDTAREIHELSNRKDGPFVTLSCPCIPESLARYELFGYPEETRSQKHVRNIGLLAEADSGTVYLDEIESLGARVQSGLLRCIKEHIIQDGDGKSASIDVRIIAGTTDDLAELTSRGKFNEDLFLCFSTYVISLPALREHPEDITLLWDCLSQMLPKPKRLSEKALQVLTAYHWPGNVKEFSHFIERMLDAKTSHPDLVDENDVTDSFEKRGITIQRP